jgi:cell division protein FtsN
MELENKEKLFVFDKREVIIIFLFMVVLTITSFTLGVNIGKKLSFERAGFSTEDLRAIEMKSDVEENVDKVVEENMNQAIDEKTKKDSLSSETFNKLKDEFQDLDDKGEGVAPQDDAISNFKEEKKVDVAQDTVPEKKDEKSGLSTLVGKYTIQLGSYKTLEDARKFADGFTIRGYNPIINEVSIENRGMWYRVSLGVFESVADAKDYIRKEKSLFQGQDYVITDIE